MDTGEQLAEQVRVPVWEWPTWTWPSSLSNRHQSQSGSPTCTRPISVSSTCESQSGSSRRWCRFFGDLRHRCWTPSMPTPSR
jgi:hypothetical protein